MVRDSVKDGRWKDSRDQLCELQRDAGSWRGIYLDNFSSLVGVHVDFAHVVHYDRDLSTEPTAAVKALSTFFGCRPETWRSKPWPCSLRESFGCCAIHICSFFTLACETFMPSLLVRICLSRVVFPAPRNPESTVVLSFDFGIQMRSLAGAPSDSVISKHRSSAAPSGHLLARALST